MHGSTDFAYLTLPDSSEADVRKMMSVGIPQRWSDGRGSNLVGKLPVTVHRVHQLLCFSRHLRAANACNLKISLENGRPRCIVAQPTAPLSVFSQFSAH